MNAEFPPLIKFMNRKMTQNSALSPESIIFIFPPHFMSLRTHFFYLKKVPKQSSNYDEIYYNMEL
jgi:hypothetical protein